MRNSIIITLLSALLLTASAIPWPVGVTPDGQDSSWTVLASYGNFHISWDLVTTIPCNFHFGIDIPDYPGFVGEDTVRCVRDGYVTDRLAVKVNTKADSQYVLVICDLMSSPDGWCYQHMDAPYFNEGNMVDLSDSIGVMTHLIDIHHLHFMRSLFEYDPYDPGNGLLNPLDSLIPPAAANSGFTWEFAESADTLFFLEEMDHLDWPAHPGSTGDVWQYQVEPDNIHDAVDLFYGYRLLGNGSNPISLGEFPLNPHMIKWTASKYLVSDTSEVLTRYVAEFTGEIGAGADSTKYRQFYFRWSRLNYLIPSLGNGLISCLTNCSDAEDWDGINNIEENCWQTDSDNQFSGVTTNPVLAAFPDGPYRIDVTSYAWDTTETHEVNLDVELHNFSPVVEKVVISCEGRTIWEAYWTADGLTPEWNNPSDQGVLPDQELDVTVVFMEPMDTTSVTVTAGVSSPYNDITASDAGLDWSWTNCPEEPEYKDTWHGVFDDLTGCTSGSMIISIQAQDHDANGLMDPSIPCADGADYNDTHHSFSVMGIQPGWPVTLEDVAFGSPVLADLDNDGDLDVIVQSTDGYVHIFQDDGTAWPGWPVSSGGWLLDVISSPAIVDINGGTLDILSVYAFGCLAHDLSGNCIADWQMGDGPYNLGYYPSMSSPAVGDVDSDGYPEIVICRHLSSNSLNEATVFMYEHDSPYRTWARNLEPALGGSSVISTPVICDVNGDGEFEIVVCTAEGFALDEQLSKERTYSSSVYILDPLDGTDVLPPLDFNCWFSVSPVVADVDNDGVNEIIIGTSGGSFGNKILVINGSDNTPEYSWDLDGRPHGPVALGDLDGNGYLDIVASVEGGIIECWSGETYEDILGFPIGINDDLSSGPSIADVDGDDDLEIVIGSTNGNLYAINNDGTICSGFPVSFGNGVQGQVVIGNIDDDNSLEMIFADDTDPLLYCYDLGAGSFPAEMPWRQFQHDSWHTGCFEADNTVPEPPTGLIGDITYNGGSCEVELEWDLSVNDPYSGSPEEPTDVICYAIYRVFVPNSEMAPEVVGLASAGDSTYVDYFSNSFNNPIVVYWATSRDGTNESELSNRVKLPTSPSDVISLGCPVIEEFSASRVLTTILQASGMQASEPEITEESSHVGIASAQERTTETLPTVTDYAVPSIGNPGCLTDGSVEVCYTPSPGADAVVIDLGEECNVTSVLPEKVLDISLESTWTDESVRTLETAAEVEPYLLIEVAGSDREFYPFFEESRNSTENVRYIKVYGASGLTEISVYGSRGVVDTVSSVEITRSAENEGWMFAIPVVEYSEEASVKIYDVSGRMIWSGYSESGSVLHWDGFTGNGTAVPNGVYLLHCSIGSEVSTGSFVVRRE